MHSLNRGNLLRQITDPDAQRLHTTIPLSLVVSRQDQDKRGNARDQHKTARAKLTARDVIIQEMREQGRVHSSPK